MSFPLVILAGGLGTRLGDLTRKIPKALIEVNGEPFITHQLRLLRKNGITRVVLCISHLGEMIRDYLGDGSRFGVEVQYAFDGPVLLGTAGAITSALPLLGDNFFVLYGDSYLECDYQAIASKFIESGKLALMTVFRNLGAYDSSNVEFSAGRILAYDKKHRTDRMHYIDYGLGLFQRAAFDHVPKGQPYDLAKLYQDLLATGELAAYEVDRRFYEIGSVAGLQELAEHLAQHR
jgi:NDP-sugar pyrophosphorylase family protein